MCPDSEMEESILDSGVKGLNFIATGEEEKLYWDKLIADREKKLSSKSRSKKRGHEKVGHAIFIINHWSYMPMHTW